MATCERHRRTTSEEPGTGLGELYLRCAVVFLDFIEKAIGLHHRWANYFNFARDAPYLSRYMANSKSKSPLVSALVGATVVLPAVIIVSHLSGNANDDKNNAKGNQQKITMTTNNADLPLSTVPEANTGMVLIPFVGAVLVVSSIRLFGAMAAKKNEII